MQLKLSNNSENFSTSFKTDKSLNKLGKFIRLACGLLLSFPIYSLVILLLIILYVIFMCVIIVITIMKKANKIENPILQFIVSYLDIINSFLQPFFFTIVLSISQLFNLVELDALLIDLIPILSYKASDYKNNFIQDIGVSIKQSYTSLIVFLLLFTSLFLYSIFFVVSIVCGNDFSFSYLKMLLDEKNKQFILFIKICHFFVTYFLNMTLSVSFVTIFYIVILGNKTGKIEIISDISNSNLSAYKKYKNDVIKVSQDKMIKFFVIASIIFLLFLCGIYFVIADFNFKLAFLKFMSAIGSILVFLQSFRLFEDVKLLKVLIDNFQVFRNVFDIDNLNKIPISKINSLSVKINKYYIVVVPKSLIKNDEDEYFVQDFYKLINNDFEKAIELLESCKNEGIKKCIKNQINVKILIPQELITDSNRKFVEKFLSVIDNNFDKAMQMLDESNDQIKDYIVKQLKATKSQNKVLFENIDITFTKDYVEWKKDGFVYKISNPNLLKVRLYGDSGSGKSTLKKILFGYIDHSGSKISGVSKTKDIVINSYKMDDSSRVLFSEFGNVRDNFMLGSFTGEANYSMAYKDFQNVIEETGYFSKLDIEKYKDLFGIVYKYYLLSSGEEAKLQFFKTLLECIKSIQDGNSFIGFSDEILGPIGDDDRIELLNITFNYLTEKCQQFGNKFILLMIDHANIGQENGLYDVIMKIENKTLKFFVKNVEGKYVNIETLLESSNSIQLHGITISKT